MLRHDKQLITHLEIAAVQRAQRLDAAARDGVLRGDLAEPQSHGAFQLDTPVLNPAEVLELLDLRIRVGVDCHAINQIAGALVVVRDPDRTAAAERRIYPGVPTALPLWTQPRIGEIGRAH